MTPRADSFVVFSLDDRWFALPAAEVAEVSKAGEVQTFPHTSPQLAGVLLHRGSVVPVWDLAGVLGAGASAPKRFCLLARRNYAAAEPTAIPVCSEGLMLHAEMQPAPPGSPAHVRGVLAFEDRPVEVLDLERVRQVKGNTP
jgi:purine-binding chemotaxis protein CheW